MEKIEKEIVIVNSQGLHARPAAMFVQIAQKYDSEITVEKDDEKVNGKSIMGILMIHDFSELKQDSLLNLESLAILKLRPNGWTEH